jgi:hypothetical protein
MQGATYKLFMLSVIMLNVVLLSVVAPLEGYHLFFTSEVNPVKSFI